jgi:hypothetical protein
MVYSPTQSPLWQERRPSVGSYQSGNELPDLLKALPRWHPGGMAPPAETISVASLVVAVVAGAALFRNEVVKAFFRVDFNPLFLTIPAALLAVSIVWLGSRRPGHWLPRAWALAVALFSLAMCLWSFWETIQARRGSPLLHSLSALSLATAVALSPRLFRVHPYSSWIQRAAPVSLVLVLAIFLPLALFAQAKVIQQQEQRLDAKTGEVRQAAEQIQNLARPDDPKSVYNAKHLGPNRSLDGLSLLKILPDEADWHALALMKRQNGMVDAVTGLVQNITAAIASEDAPKLALSRFYNDKIDETHDTKWRENYQFARASTNAGAYYRELARLLAETEKGVENTPIANVYQQERQALQERLDEHSRQFGERWISDLIRGEKSSASLQWVTETYVGDAANRLIDLNRWKGMRWSEARSLLGQHGCAKDAVRLPRYEKVLVPDSNEPSGYREEIVKRFYDRVECYAYRPSTTSNGLEMLAELHLIYKEGSGNAPYKVSLLFDVPPNFGRFQEQLMQTLVNAAQEKYGVHPDNLQGATPLRGFYISSSRASFTASPIVVERQVNVRTIEVRVF